MNKGIHGCLSSRSQITSSSCAVAVIENGLFPEVTVWSQVKKIDPAIYKLYEELIISDEPLEKRLELLFLASEFFIHNRTLMAPVI